MPLGSPIKPTKEPSRINKAPSVQINAREVVIQDDFVLGHYAGYRNQSRGVDAPTVCFGLEWGECTDCSIMLGGSKDHRGVFEALKL